MAYSGTVKTLQDVLLCGLCETDTNIKVKCMDCDLYMCQKCSDKVHGKFKNADLHDIVALENIHSHIHEEDRKCEFKPVKCKDHRQQICCMYCITCGLLVCPMCIAKTHQQHLFEEIQTICQQKMEETKKILAGARLTIFNLKQNLYLMAHIEKSKSYETGQKILEEEKHAKKVQLQCIKLNQELEEETKRHAMLLKEKESEILENERDIKIALEKVEKIHTSRNTSEFLEATSKLQKQLRSYEQSANQKPFNVKILQYVPNYKIQSKSKSIELEIQFEIKEKYKIDMSQTISLSAHKNGHIWLTDGDKMQQFLVKEGTTDITLLKKKIPIIQTRFLDWDILCTTSRHPAILHLNYKGEIRTFKDLSPSVPFSIDVSNNEIIVGMVLGSVKDKADLPFIIRLGFDGEIIQVYKNHGRQYVKRDIVRCCTTIHDGAICYIDSCFIKTGNRIGNVVFMSREGRIEWNYEGNPFLNSKDIPFRPLEVLSTKNNNFVVSECDHPTFHIITQLGELLTIVNLSLVGLTDLGPSTIDIHGNLWTISHVKGKKELFLCNVEFSGF